MKNEVINEILKESDISEFVSELPNKSDLIKAAKDIPFKILTLKEICNLPHSEREWLVENFIPKGICTILSGDPGSFKSMTSIHLAFCLSEGINVFGKFPCKKSRVLIIDKENKSFQIKERYSEMGSSLDNSMINYMDYQNAEEFFLDQKSDDIDYFINYIAENFDLVIIDTFSKILKFTNENDANELRYVESNIRKILLKGKNIILLDHLNKRDVSPAHRLRGSSSKLAFTDQLFMNTIIDDKHFVIANIKNRDGLKVDNITVEILKSPILNLKSTDTYIVENKNILTKRLILELLKKGSTETSEILEFVQKQGGYGINDCRKLLLSLTESNLINREKKNGNKFYYNLIERNEDST